MSQQLHLFCDRPSNMDWVDRASPSSPLLEQTRQLFGDDRCSTTELVQRILSATKAIDQQCAQPVQR
jgi:hypothetical protein